MKPYYERNDYLLNHEDNLWFEEVLWMDDDAFRQWCISLRKTVVHAWDVLGLPPRVGYTEADIIKQFDKMGSFPVHEFEEVDHLTGKNNCIRGSTIVGNAANQWFPTMMKTRINYTNNDDGRSIYDFFAKDELLDKFITYAHRHFHRDSFYHYSRPITGNDPKSFLFHADSAAHWVEQFESKERRYFRSDYWLCPKQLDSSYTGYTESIKDQDFLFLTNDEAESLDIPDKCKTNVSRSKDHDGYQIRYFEYGQKLFPLGLKAFRISFCQYAVNFPPLTAKYLYEKYTEHVKSEDIVIYDPSAGWGGRILGAMAVKDDRQIHYVGTDPNSDHTLPDGTTKYEALADFYNSRTSRGNSLFPHTNTYHIFQDGSEVIGENPDFQKYEGLVDVCFTSPPYFAKELYSDDPGQSATKFNTYDTWRDGFLRPTLETAVEYLKSGGYLLWNIANAKFGKDILPLEDDSRAILKDLGMEYQETLFMILAQMPGGNRIDEATGLPKTESYCKIWNAAKTQQNFQKYEPIFCYRKP